MAIILMYHRVADVTPDPFGLSVTPEHFAEHLDVLSRFAHPVPLAAAATDCGSRTRSVVLTFDDGYADNVWCACPLLERFDVPATIFVATGYVGATEFWWDALCRLTIGNEPCDTAWRAWHGHMTAAQAQFCDHWEFMRALSPAERLRAVEELCRKAAPAGPARSRPLDGSELNALARCDLIELGCHTRTHPVLSSLDAASQRDEIFGSRRDLEELTGTNATSFAYPYGHRADYSSIAIELVRQAGFHIACANESNAVADRDPLQLPRIHVDNWDGDEFARRLGTWLHQG